MSVSDVLNRIREEGVKFVDYRFTDTRGKEQHVTVPAHAVDEEVFESGKMFDGSSISGWKGINESDMILMPEASTAIMDPFSDEPTLNVRCDVIEPSTMQGYERCPRSLAKRAEAYMQSTGIADQAFFGPEPEFFVFDHATWGDDMGGAFYRIDSEEAAWNTGKDYDEGNIGHRPGVKAVTFRCLRWTRCTTCAPPCARRWKRWASLRKCTTTKSAPPVSAKSAPSSTPWCVAPTRTRS